MVDVVCGQSVYCSSWEKNLLVQSFNSGGFEIWLVQQTHLSGTPPQYTNNNIYLLMRSYKIRRCLFL